MSERPVGTKCSCAENVSAKTVYLKENCQITQIFQWLFLLLKHIAQVSMNSDDKNNEMEGAA